MIPGPGTYICFRFSPRKRKIKELSHDLWKKGWAKCCLLSCTSAYPSVNLAKVSLLGFTSKEGHKPGERRDTNPDFRTATTLCRGHQAVGRDSRLPSILSNGLFMV